MAMNELTKEKQERFWRLVAGDDMDYYEDYLLDLPEEEQRAFFMENPDFLSEFGIGVESLHLLQELSYRNILRGIKSARS